MKEHVTPTLLLVGADDRILRFRHPIPTSRPIEAYVMLVVCEPNMFGARTAGRITEMMKSLQLDVGQAYLVLNRCRTDLAAEVAQTLAGTGLDIVARIPDDPQMGTFELQQRSLLQAPADASAVMAVDRLVGQLLERRTI